MLNYIYCPYLQASYDYLVKVGISEKKLCKAQPDLDHTEPTSGFQALSNANWTVAMHEEFLALQNNKTWTLIPLTDQMDIIGNKWIFKLKRILDGSTNRYNAGLVIKSFYKNPKIDFKETFSRVIKPSAIRRILSIVIYWGWMLRQIDIKKVVLNGTL